MVRMEVIIPKELLVNVERLTRVIENTLDQEAAAVKEQFNRTTTTWVHRPLFLVDKKAGERTIYTTDKVYGYVSLGTAPHIIRPRRAKALHFFRTGFRAKSRVRLIERSNKGAQATKGETFTQVVHHPGTQAREFAEAIQEKWDKELPRQMQRAVDAEVSRGG